MATRKPGPCPRPQFVLIFSCGHMYGFLFTRCNSEQEREGAPGAASDKDPGFCVVVSLSVRGVSTRKIAKETRPQRKRSQQRGFP